MQFRWICSIALASRARAISFRRWRILPRRPWPIGKVYVATQSSLEVFGLFHIMSVVGGNNQTAQVLNPLPQPLQIVTSDPYTGQPISGVTVTFSDGGKGGVFNPPTQVTDVNGQACTTYTFPKKSGPYTLTASAANFGTATAFRGNSRPQRTRMPISRVPRPTSCDSKPYQLTDALSAAPEMSTLHRQILGLFLERLERTMEV